MEIAQGRPGTSARPPASLVYSLAGCIGIALWAAPACAQQAANTDPNPAIATADGAASTADAEHDQAPDSRQQGQVLMSESFEKRPIRNLLSESRREGIRDTTFNAQLRTYFMDGSKFDGDPYEAWAIGGSAGVKSGYFWDHLAVGATGYTSLRLYGPPDKNGTDLLQNGQYDYTVLGEIYGELLLTKTIRATFGKEEFETPYINGNDTRMTPNTFEAFAIQGAAGSDWDSRWNFGAGYVDKIKLRNDDYFESMAAAAGAPAGVNSGVWVAGLNYHFDGIAIGVVDYQSPNIINIGYAEARYTLPLSKSVKLIFAAQYANQHSVGEDLLFGHAFSTDQAGVKFEVSFGSWLFTTAYTGTGTGSNIQNPWGAYPGFTSSQIENFYRAGEDAVMLRAAYTFESVKGLSAYLAAVLGSQPTAASQYPENEYDGNIEWSAPAGTLKGLMLRARYAYVQQNGGGNPRQAEGRLMVFYTPPGF